MRFGQPSFTVTAANSSPASPAFPPFPAFPAFPAFPVLAALTAIDEFKARSVVRRRRHGDTSAPCLGKHLGKHCRHRAVRCPGHVDVHRPRRNRGGGVAAHPCAAAPAGRRHTSFGGSCEDHVLHQRVRHDSAVTIKYIACVRSSWVAPTESHSRAKEMPMGLSDDDEDDNSLRD